jgi:hypothetical protein
MTDVLGPRGRNPRTPEGNQLPFEFIEDQLSFDAEAFDNLIRSQGVKVTHYKAIPDPRGMASRGDTHDVLGIRESTDGFIYKPCGCFQGWFNGNTNSPRPDPKGIIEEANATMTVPRCYEGTEEAVLISEYDRLYLTDIEIRVINLQYLEASATGVDRLQYPATCVEFLVDANGVFYDENVDFTMSPEGDIIWSGQKRPGWNAQTGRGTVFSVRYRYTPFFVVENIIHEIRVAQITDYVTGDRNLTRMPYQLRLVREKVFRDKNRDGSPLKMYNPRYTNPPTVAGKMGPVT